MSDASPSTSCSTSPARPADRRRVRRAALWATSAVTSSSARGRRACAGRWSSAFAAAVLVTGGTVAAVVGTNPRRKATRPSLRPGAVRDLPARHSVTAAPKPVAAPQAAPPVTKVVQEAPDS